MQLLLVRIFTVLLQILAGILAVQLIRITNKKTVWVFISGAILLTALERSLTYYQLIYGADVAYFRIASEYIAFYIAIFMLFGVGGLHTLFKEINRSHSQVIRSERKYRTLLENLPQCIYLKDSNQVYASCNENFARDVGMPSDQIEGKTDFDLFDIKTAERNQVNDQRVMDDGLLEERDIESERDGRPVIFHAIRTSVDNHEVGPPGLLVVYWDVTEIRQSEIEHRKLEEKMRQAQKLESLGVLAGGIAHDFNNLLTGILGNTYLALKALPEDSEMRGGLQEIESAANRAADLTSQMLAYSGQGQYDLKRLNLASEISEFTDLMRASISKRALLELELDEDMPLIEADPFQLEQIVINLTTNASEAIGDTNGIIRISAGSSRYGRDVLKNSIVNMDKLEEAYYTYLQIEDTGCGFAEEDGPRLFEPFYSTKFTGRGLGLAAVLGIVRAQGGGILVSSKLGKGSSFTVLFPQADVDQSAVSSEMVEDAAIPETGGTGMVLIVDDERVVREVARRLIEIAGFTAMTAANGPEALEIYKMKRDEIDCVLLDLTMPLMSGQEVLSELRKINSRVQVIISSAYKESDVIPRFIEQKFVDFVQKPYNYAKLYEALRHAIG